METPDFILTIDLGTSGPKVSIFNEQLNLECSEFHDVPLQLLGSEGVEQNPSDWIQAIEKCISKLRNHRPELFPLITAINVTSQWSGTVALDRAGRPLGNAISWMDSRGAPHAQKLMDGLIKVDGYEIFRLFRWIQITGGGPTKSGKDSISHILYLKHERPEIYQQTDVFLEPKDFLNFFLSGRKCASHDSITVHWLTDNRDIHRIRYSETLIKKSGIDRNKLPELIPTNSILGKIRHELAREWGLSTEVSIIAGTPDLHSAAVGSGGVKDFTPHLYIGTSAWIVCHVPFKKTDLFHNMASIPSGIPGRYMLVNEQQTAGACLQYLKNQVFYPHDSIDGKNAPSNIYHRMDELAGGTPAGSEGLLFLPWLNGERSPMDQQHLRGGFINLSLKHEQKHLIRAVMEGVAFNLRWLMGYTEKFCGKPFEALHFIGGGAHSSVWSQILADALDRPIKKMKDPLTANSKGAAALALVALGKLKLEDIEKHVQVDEVFTPSPKNRSIYDLGFKQFLSFYKSNQAFFKSMNQKEPL